MTYSVDKRVSTLNDLTSILIDSKEGFAEAAEAAKDGKYRTVLREFSQQRFGFATRLQGQTKRLGREPRERGSMSGALHHAWINVRDSITGKDDYAVLAECERGEDVAVSHYRQALEADLAADIRVLLETQYRTVRETHDPVRALRDAERDRASLKKL